MFQTETGASCKLPSPFVVYGDRAGSRTDILFYGNDIEVGINLAIAVISYAPIAVKFVSYAPVCLASSAATPSLREASLSIFPKGDPA